MATRGLPKILVDFQTKATSAIIRSSRGVGAMILNDDNVDELVYFSVKEAADVSDTLSDESTTLIKKALQGAPSEIHVFLVPPETVEVDSEVTVTDTVNTTTTINSEVIVHSTVTVTNADTGETDTVESDITVDSEITIETTTVINRTVISSVTVTSAVTAADALRLLADMQINWICHPTGTARDQQDLASWVISQRNNRHRTFKCVVANYAGDNPGVVNFTTGKIKVVNPDWTDALDGALGDESLIPSTIPHYNYYTATQYTARIMGILAGIGLDRSATYYPLSEIVSCATYSDLDAAINRGELCLFDEHDGNGVKIARGVNSFVNFTTKKDEKFGSIKIVEGIDLIADDISSTFKNNYIGKVVNTYANKKLFISSILVYLNGLKGTVLDNSDSAENYVELDTEANASYAKLHGVDTSSYSNQQLLEINTGSEIFLRGKLTPLDTMEDLELHFVL